MLCRFVEGFVSDLQRFVSMHSVRIARRPSPALWVSNLDPVLRHMADPLCYFYLTDVFAVLRSAESAESAKTGRGISSARCKPSLNLIRPPGHVFGSATRVPASMLHLHSNSRCNHNGEMQVRAGHDSVPA